MIKSLYVRVVLTYVTAVSIGLISAFLLSQFVIQTYGDQFIENLQIELAKDAASLEQAIRSNGIEQVGALLKQKGYAEKYDVRLYDSSRVMRVINGRDSSDLFIIPDQVVRFVLNGETYRGRDVSPSELVIGIPYEEAGSRYALFIQASEGSMSSVSTKLLIFALIINLLVGCVIIIIGAKYLVRPIRGMKAATEQLARGEFDIELEWSNRKDELGQLARSFNYMASQMQQLEGMRQTFVSNVSHEIQSPLTSISGFSKALQHNHLSEEERIRYLTIIQQESERVSRLTENLLKLASLESQHHPFSPCMYDLDEQLRQVVVSIEPLWSDKSIEWEMDLSRTKIKADEDQLNQVWMNIISNSIKFSPIGGHIRITIVKHIGSIEVRITDSGIGIPEEEQVKVFERFYKVDKSHNKIKSGNGLGLAIVKKIVSLHGGTVVLKSNSDAGITVIVTLPHIIS
ncbi:sensor histidine kinase [Paenibacillus agilis]|uniref:Heme sensor protein HssS n=1 Tax=Paenibacillus agilis TaxID=3020863 RepID=A0A559IXK9_9BACL|nr:sensor histidine kinase [Paenibacillus agilis]TVX92369.1 HAMP domain-containing protein [Paenibacillus agilis]